MNNPTTIEEAIMEYFDISISPTNLLATIEQLVLERVIGDDYYCKYEEGTRIVGYCKWCDEPRHKHTGWLQRQALTKLLRGGEK